MHMIKHFITITSHRIKVMNMCFKCGLIWRGITHDLSKYSPKEFIEGAKYYVGTYSPNAECRRLTGKSEAWLHHKGRNKHHHEYWYDYEAPLKTPIIPFKYCVEMICDMIAASKVYQGKKYTTMSAYYYWNKTRDNAMVNKKIQGFITEVLELLGAYGENVVIKKDYLKRIYDKHINDKERNLYG